MKKILIIDDDQILLETATDILREQGYEVLQADNGKSGIEIAMKFLPDLILCDVMMPGIDGYQVHSQLQSGLATNQIPFIFMTAKASKEEIRFGMDSGADDYVTKPIDFKQLQRVINIRLAKYDYTIKRNESTYQALFEMDHEAIIIMRPSDGIIVDANQAGMDILGYSKHELLGMTIFSILRDYPDPEDFLMNDETDVHKSFRTREGAFKHRNNHLIPVQISGTNFEIQGEKLFFIIARNLTDLKEKEQALRDSDERYRNLVENTGEGLGVVDAEEVFIYANAAACEIFGLSPEQLIGKSLLSFIDPITSDEIKHQTDLRKEGQKSMYELEILRLDGERRWIVVTATPQYDGAGKFISAFGIFRDITQRKLAEIKVRESEKRLREIVDMTNDWIWEISPTWKYLYVSPKVFEILGYQPEELIGKSPFEFMVMEDVAISMVEVRTLVHQYKPLNAIENRARHKNGQLVYLETSGIPVFDEKGVYLGYRGADRDITIRKQNEREIIIAKEKAEESDRLKSSILANISHELRTPLNGILGFSEILKEELGDSEYMSMIENIHNSGKRLMATLNSIITLSQLEAGKLHVSMRETLISASIVSVVKSMGSLASEKNILMETSDVMPFTVITDDQLFKQLLRQILDNSIKFTDNGTITVETFSEISSGCPFVVTKVSDTGIGIEKDYFDLIFQEFRQVSEGFGRKYQGSGIGLTISKKIIDLLSGFITVESEPGKGSAFSIWLPYKPHNDNKSEIYPPDSSVLQVKTVSRDGEALPLILLVEDNIVNKELTELFLQPLFVVDHAPNGIIAIEKAKSKQYAAALMDINLGPGLTGLDVTRELRGLPGYAHIPIIAVTGYAMAEDQEKIVAAGCSNHIAKPFDRKSLINMLEDELKKSGAQSE